MSKETFGTCAAQLCGVAAVLLGWRPREFWDSTPAELATTLQPQMAADGIASETLADLMRRFPDEGKR